MSVVWRLLSVAALALSAGILLFSIITARREQRVRPGLDLLRLAITVVTTTLMARLLGVTTPEALMGAGLLGGLVVGLYEGLHLQVRFLGKRAFVRRTVLGVAAWGAGVVVVQTAGVIGRVGLADLGLAMSFFGIGQVVGLLTGRWQSVVEARRARAGSLAGAALVVLAVAAGFLPGWAAWAQPTDTETEDLGGGDVQVTLRWSSLADLDLSVTDPAGDTVSFNNPTIASGGQLDRDANFPCDTATTAPVENVFWPPGEAARGSYRVAVTYQTGCGTEPAESYELTVLFGDEVVRQVDGTIDPGQVIAVDLVYEGGGRPAGSGDLSAAEGTSAAMVGLGGTALLLGTALMGSGNSVASLVGAWKGGRVRGLRDLAAGGRGGGGVVPWRDPSLELSRGRAAAALDRLPPDLQITAREAVLARLETEETDRLVDIVRGVIGAPEAGADPAAALAAGEKAAGLLSRLPPEVRERVEGRLLGGLREERLQGAIEAAATGEGLGPGVELDAEADLSVGLHRDGRVESVLADLPGEMRAEAEGRLLERLEAERLGRWVERLRGVAAPAVGEPGGSVLDTAEAQHLLAGLPPGLRERVQAHASHVLESELVEDLVGRAKRAIERSRATELLAAAFGRGDGDRADAVVNAVGAALDLTGETDLERLLRQATGGGIQGLRSLPRSGGVVPPVDLTGHLAGEPDLLAAARRVEGVEAVLTGAGPGLRPQVEQALVQALDEGRIDRVVEEAAQALGSAGTAAADVMSAVRDVPGMKGLFQRLAEVARDPAYRLLGERLKANRVEGAVDEVSRAVNLDRAEESLRAAARVDNLDAADRILRDLSAEEAQDVSAAALGEA